MNRDDVLRLAEELREAVETYPQMSEDEPGGYCSKQDYLLDSAAIALRQMCAELDSIESAVRAHEREECARVCESLTASCFDPAYNESYLWCAAAIRARGNNEPA